MNCVSALGFLRPTVVVTKDSALGWIPRRLQWLSTYNPLQLRFVALTATAFVLLAVGVWPGNSNELFKASRPVRNVITRAKSTY